MKRKDADEIMGMINRLMFDLHSPFEIIDKIRQKLESLITEDENEKKKEG